MGSEAVMKAKAEIYLALCDMDQSALSADKRWAAYHEALGMYVCRRLSKAELDTIVLRALGAENIRKHNALLLALLADATRRAHKVREGGAVGATWRKVLNSAANVPPSAEADDDDDSDDDLAALQRSWREAELAATAPRPREEGPRSEARATSRLDGAGLVALKMDNISVGLGLDGVSPSAVHLMTLALHSYARRAMRQCHSELSDQQDINQGAIKAEQPPHIAGAPPNNNR